jgi:hypothetical protein
LAYGFDPSPFLGIPFLETKPTGSRREKSGKQNFNPSHKKQ